MPLFLTHPTKQELERMDHAHYRRHPRPRAISDAIDVRTLATNNANGGGSNTKRGRTSLEGIRDQDQHMPIANVTRIMRRILPPNAKISDEAKETVQECVSEYISFITGEANDRCHSEHRKTISAEDILYALGKLGFEDYIEPLTVYLSHYREMEAASLHTDLLFVKRKVGGEQQHGVADIETLFSIGNVQGTSDASAMGEYYKNGLGASASGYYTSSKAAMPSFDPSAKY